MERFMVGLDGSKASDAALRWAARIAAHVDAEVVAVHSYLNPYADPGADGQDPMLAERARELASAWTENAAASGATIRTEVLDGDARVALMARVDQDAPDLLVLGRTGRGGGPGFLHLGSVVEHAAHVARCPLAVIPSDSGTAVRRVVIGVDGSETSAAAVEWCARFAAATGAEVIAVTVREPVAEWTPAWDEHNWRRDAERDIASWTKPIEAAGVEVEPLPTENLHPADGLLGVASAGDADLIVLGTRGAGGFTGLRFGGVAMKVLHRTSLPLVLVPPQAH